MEVRARGHSHRSLSLCRWLASHCCSESSGQWPASAREDLRISADGGCEAAARTRQQLHRTAQIIPFKQMGIGTGFRTRCSLLTFRKIFRVFFLILKFSKQTLRVHRETCSVVASRLGYFSLLVVNFYI